MAGGEIADEKPKPKTTEKDVLMFMIRPCETYQDEYEECTSIKGRFQQYFIHGETIDCNDWKRDYDNCERLRKNPDNEKAFDELIVSERKRRRERLAPHFQNTVWTKRSEPPLDWNKPLPDWLEKENENTYLAFKAEEIRVGKQNPNGFQEKENSFCSIS